MEEASSQQKLLELLKAGQPEGQELNRQGLRYAIYARKSTTGDEKQASSIEDQIRDCIERVATPLNLNVVKIYQESYSAKVADTREEFKQLVLDIQHGKIDGLIAWHPDRLSRNMKEAGTIIDLVDRDLIRDLQFSTFTFENNPAGKMLLGITFVMAKQYSEHLSESVDRGNRRAVEDAEFIGKFKHGYIVDAERHFQPDPENFVKVRHAFEMILEGSSQKDAAAWLNEVDYKVQKRQGANPTSHVWNKDDISELVRDPHYAGVHKWGKNLIDLVDAYDFQPMVSVDDFLKINRIDSLQSAKVLTLHRPRGGDVRADLLRQMVYCGHCNKTMTSMVIDKKKDGEIYESRFYYRCETLGCELYNRSARAKIVLDAARQFFSQYLFTTKSNYAEYIRNAKNQIKRNSKQNETKIAQQRILIANKEASYERYKKLIEEDSSLKKHYNLDKILSEIEALKAKQNHLIQQKRDAPSALPDFKEYLKLLESTPVILGKTRDMNEMNRLIRIFFLNFTITATGKSFAKGSKVTAKLKEPWNGFLENDDFVLGAGKETLTPGLFHGKEAL